MAVPLIIIGAAIGAAGGLYANSQRGAEARRAQKNLDEQEAILRKQQQTSRSMLRLQGEGMALENTANSRNRAAQAFQAESAGEAALGVSGTTGGTPFYQLANMAAQNRQTLGEANQLADIGMQNHVLSGVMQGLEFDSRFLSLQQAQDDVDTQLDYLNSPLSWMLAGGTGAASGAQMGANLENIRIQNKGAPQAAATKPVGDVQLSMLSTGFDDSAINYSQGLSFDRDIFGGDLLPVLDKPLSLDSLNPRAYYGGV